MSENKKTIVLIFPRGEAIRNFFYSGTAAMLRKEARLVIISVVPNAAIGEELKAGCDAFYKLEPAHEPYNVRLIREILDLAHNRFIWTAASKLRFNLRDQDAKTLPHKLKRWAKKTSATILANQSSLYRLSSLEERFAQKSNSVQQWKAILKKEKPSYVFNGSHIHNKVSLPVVHAAKSLGIKIGTFLFSWDNLTSQGRIIPMYDQFMVWNEAIKKDLLAMYPHLKSDQARVVGTPQFDFHFKTDWFETKEAFAAHQNLDATKPWVLYTTGMPNHMPHEPEIVEMIADILQAHPDQPQLILRVYPKDTTNRFEDLRERRPDIHFQKVPWEPNWLMPLKEDLALFTNTLRHVALGINVASTVSLELAIFDKPIINVAFNPLSLDPQKLKYADYYEFEHYKRVVSYGGIALAFNPEELKSQIQTALENPEKFQADRKTLVQKFFGTELDGKSYQRIAEFQKKLLIAIAK